MNDIEGSPKYIQNNENGEIDIENGRSIFFGLAQPGERKEFIASGSSFNQKGENIKAENKGGNQISYEISG